MNESAFASIVARFECRVHWGDCDPLGIIFYPTYFRWMDEATWSFIDGVYGIRFGHNTSATVSGLSKN